MGIAKSKQVWLHPVEGLNLSIEADQAEINTLAKKIEIVGIASDAANPKKTTRLSICLGFAEAQKLAKQVQSARALKKELRQVRAEMKAREDLCQEAHNENVNLASRLSATEELNRNLQYNLDVLRDNINDRELMVASALNRGASASSGMARLSELGGAGKPLQGGLPGQGKGS